MCINLQRKYDNFWRDFYQVIPHGNEIIPRDSPFTFIFNKTNLLINAKVLFQRCYCRSVPGQKVDIILQMDQTITKIAKSKKNKVETFKLIKSTVRAYYFEILDTERKFIGGLRYDYEVGQSIDHPIFHCQIDDSFDDNLLTSFRLKNVTVSNISRQLRNTKIPTANMDLGSVMLSIMADHYNEDDFRKMLTIQGKDWFKEMPHFEHQGFLNKIRQDDNQSFRSHCWYGC
jgi:hypothetical protein